MALNLDAVGPLTLTYGWKDVGTTKGTFFRY
jgi:hypothetical protein